VKQELKDKAVQLNDRRIYKCNCLLAVRGDFAKNNADQIRAFLRALIKAEQFVRDNRDEAISILSKELDINPTVLAAFWDEYVLGVKLDASLVQTFADTGAWIVRSQKGFENKTAPTYLDVLSPGFLGEVDGARVIATAK
jgi:NitT/TauT family transport system substrate-binding protein